MFDTLKQFFARLAPKSGTAPTGATVAFDDEKVVCRRSNGKEEIVRWADLGAVIIETNDSGPFSTDVHWLLLGRDAASGCVVPGGAEGESELVKRLQQLPGFDNNSVIAAMGSVTNQSFLCWKADDENG